ncbi:MAG: thioredoxin-disulfide reductase [Candidatus Micrarchaeaceae archaeon]
MKCKKTLIAMVEDLVIIGSGPAGLTAALYGARDGFKPLVISGTSAGGQLLLTTTVENFPGFPDGIYGSEIIDRMRKQAEKFGARFVDGDATAVDFSSKPLKVFVGSDVYEAFSVIVATGASARWLGIPSEKKFIGKGVSSCATCDAAFFKNKDVIVVGGGDTAMEDSIFLTNFVNSVTVVHRRDRLRASQIMQERAFANSKIKFIWNSVVEEILGDAKVSGVKLRNVITNEITEMKVDGVFVAVGYEPNTAIFKGQLKLDEQGYIVADEEVKTDVEGVFVAGDVADKFYRQAITAAGSGAKAALKAREFLLKLKYEQSKVQR